MILPTDDLCRRVIDQLAEEPNLNEWESEFVASNMRRQEFTDKQKLSISKLMDKYHVK